MKELKIVYSKHFPWRGYIAITLLRWCIVRESAKERFSCETYTHESIHYAQERELWYVGFYILYALFFIWELRCFSWHHAYRNIAFEREAYAHQGDRDYLANRKKFAWVKEKKAWRV